MGCRRGRRQIQERHTTVNTYEVWFAGEDDDLCAQRAGGSYFVDNEHEAAMHVAQYQAAGFDAGYHTIPAEWTRELAS